MRRTVCIGAAMVGFGCLMGFCWLEGLGAAEGLILDAKGNVIQRAEPPKAQELQKAEKLVDEVFGRDLAKAKSASEKSKLAQEIRKSAREEEDLAVRFAAMQAARRLAVEALDGKLGLEIVREIVATYQPLEEMSKEDRLAEADRLWSQAERSQGREKLAKQLEAVEAWYYAEVKTGLAAKKWEDRIASISSDLPIIRLEAKHAKCNGSLRYAPEVDSIGWWEGFTDYVEWIANLPKGEYKITVCYNNGQQGAGGVVGVSIFRPQQNKPIKTLPMEVKPTLPPGQFIFVEASIGKIVIPAEGEYVVRVHPIKKSPAQKYIIQLRRVTLEP